MAPAHEWRTNAASTRHHLRNLREARTCSPVIAACYERALNIFQTVEDRWGEADTLGDIRHATGELPQAREAWQQTLAILDDLHHPDAANVRAKLARTDP